MLRVSRHDGNESLTEVAQMQLPAEPQTERHGAASETPPHAGYARFAKSVSRRLDTERRKGGFDEVVIIAAPEFLGLLRPQLSAPTRECTVREIPKDLLRASDAQILRSARPAS